MYKYLRFDQNSSLTRAAGNSGNNGNLKLSIDMSNCKYAFLNGEIDEEIYIYTQMLEDIFLSIKNALFCGKEEVL